MDGSNLDAMGLKKRRENCAAVTRARFHLQIFGREYGANSALVFGF